MSNPFVPITNSLLLDKQCSARRVWARHKSVVRYSRIWPFTSGEFVGPSFFPKLKSAKHKEPCLVLV
jgi:hypothetical protein